MHTRFNPKYLPASLAMVVLTTAVVPLAQAETSGDDRWRFQATPYVWMSGMEGQVRPFRSAPTAEVDKSFSELMDSLDAAAFITGTARRGNVVLQADLTHAATSDSTPLPLGLAANVKVRQTSATLTAGYAVRADERTGIDLLAGIRYWDINAAVQVPGLLAARSDSSFVDPIAGVRWRQVLSPRWSSVAYADVGGFGHLAGAGAGQLPGDRAVVRVDGLPPPVPGLPRPGQASGRGPVRSDAGGDLPVRCGPKPAAVTHAPRKREAPSAAVQAVAGAAAVPRCPRRRAFAHSLPRASPRGGDSCDHSVSSGSAFQ
jgi:hypothetical protein